MVLWGSKEIQSHPALDLSLHEFPLQPPLALPRRKPEGTKVNVTRASSLARVPLRHQETRGFTSLTHTNVGVRRRGSRFWNMEKTWVRHEKTPASGLPHACQRACARSEGGTEKLPRHHDRNVS